MLDANATIKTVLNTDPAIKTASRICFECPPFPFVCYISYVSSCFTMFAAIWKQCFITNFQFLLSRQPSTPMKKLFGAFNPMNLILLANQFELKLFNKTIGPNKNSGTSRLFSSAKKFSRKKSTTNLPEVEELAMMETQRLQPNVRIYSRTIKACDLSAKWKQAVCLLTIAESKEVQLDVIICTAAISFLVWGSGGNYLRCQWPPETHSMLMYWLRFEKTAK